MKFDFRPRIFLDSRLYVVSCLCWLFLCPTPFPLYSSTNHLGGVFDDHVALIRQMGARYPYMDLDRVGVYGTSAGGYAASHAILVHPEFYKVCISISADHDARLDKAWWNELYQGYPIGKDYKEQSNVTLAGQLQGRLLLIHGDVDHNVHPVGTMRFADALIKANKNFDMLLVPNMYHGEGGNPYLIRRRWDYFVEHLLGVEPPKDFQIPRRRGGPPALSGPGTELTRPYSMCPEAGPDTGIVQLDRWIVGQLRDSGRKA